VSSGRLVTWAKASAGTRDGTSGAKLGTTSLTWACSEAAVLLLRNHPAAQTDLARLAPNQGQGNALTIFAHQWARAVYDLRTRDTVCDRQKCRTGSWGGAGEPTASRDDQGLRLACGALIISRRQGRVGAPRLFGPAPLACDWTSAPALERRRAALPVHVCCPSPAPATHGRTRGVAPPLGRGRYEGTERFLGRRGPYQRFSALTMAMVTAPQYVCGADTPGLGRLRAIKPAHVARDR
jgi:hypothetical protein